MTLPPTPLNNSKPLQVSRVGGSPGQEVGSSLDVEQLEGEDKEKVGTFVKLTGKVFVDREMHC